MKGIVSQSVKEILQSLVDDGLVQADKIGSSNCMFSAFVRWDRYDSASVVFWSFPSQQGALIQNRLSAAKELKATHESQIKEITDAIEKEKASREDTEERKAALATLSEMKREICKLDEELSAYGACDPVKLEETRRAITLAKEAALRWTGTSLFPRPPACVLTSSNPDNFGILLSHFTRQNGAPAEDVRKYLGVEDEYEDIY
ncbi:Meiotic nuclear division protein 1 [Marasmius tenuissimus]|uniref:Meiotic nuclear division protein 1 n=1 Tax=Marasmius tenuissimus TaxID=585030 RepID=A0ABR3AIF5_9AGAR